MTYTKLFMEVGVYRVVKLYLQLLGLMTASMSMVLHACLYMRPIQLYFNYEWDARRQSLDHPIIVPCRILPNIAIDEAIGLI